MKKHKKTNVMRMLDQAHIPYETKSCEYTEEDLSGIHTANILGYSPNMVFKTIVTQGDKTGPIVFCLPSCYELNLKTAAKVSGNTLTGYVRGGCSPIGMKKEFPTYIDSHCKNHTLISISAGQRGMQVLISPQALIQFIHAIVVEITKK